MDDIQLVMKVDTAPVDRAVRVMDNLEAELRDVERAMGKGLITEKQYNAETKRLTQSMDRLKTVAKGSSKDFRAFEKTVYGSGKAMRQKEIAMQQAGYQLQDFIVQVQAGTNPLIAFSQQGSQLAGFFAGPWGAAIGLGIAALGGLGTALLGTKGKTKDLYDETEAFIDLMDGYQDAADSAGESATTLSESFGNLASTVREARDAILELRQAQLDQQMTDMFGQFREQYVQGGAGDRRAALAKLFGLTMTPKGFRDPEGNLRGGQIGELMAFMTAAESGETNEERLKFLKMALTTAKELALVNGSFTKDEQALLSSIENIYKAFEGAVEKTTKKASESIQEIGLDAFGGAGRSQADINAGLQILKDIGEEKRQQALFDSTTRANEAAAENRLRVVREQANDAAIAYIKRRKNEAILALGDEADQLISNVNLGLELDREANAEKQKNMLNTMNYQYSLVEDVIQQTVEDMENLNDEAEELGKRLGIGFEAALEIIRRAKAEATVGLDAFGGAGDFKYSVPTYFDPNKGKKKGKTPAQELDEYLTKMERRVKLEQKQVGVSEEVARTLELREEYEKRGLKVNNSRIDALVKEEAALRKATELQEKHTARVDMIGDAFGDMLMNVVDGTMKADEAFKSFMASILKQLYQELAIDPAVSFLKSFLLADGGVMSRGKLTPFAYGGVVNGPTVFPMANGMGLMGEAGPEAIMPLKRGPNGKLGVEGGGGVTVVQNINVSTGVQQTVRTEIKSLMPQIAEASKAAVADAKRRGGSYGRNFS